MHYINPIVIIRSPVDGRLFLTYPRDSGALPQSFDKLQLFDDGPDIVSVMFCLALLFFLLSPLCRNVHITSVSSKNKINENEEVKAVI